MHIHQAQTTDVMLEELGRRLRQTRIGKNLTQAELGIKAGLDRKSVAKAEKGGDVNLNSFVRLLRALGAANDIDMLMRETPSLRDPFEVIESIRTRRRRVRHPKAAKG